jgi:hypothetical protein
LPSSLDGIQWENGNWNIAACISLSGGCSFLGSSGTLITGWWTPSLIEAAFKQLDT